ncbi:fumarylacetoacetate hydrolase family protein [Ramlibacter sp.]|uniref:fumarylacetoacetate hydrolase family protein n=1 Tax=Ramlibacter sp. TaxID=1917967 RepID=UPI003D0C4628
MKIGRYRGEDGAERLGLVLDKGGAVKVLDLVAAAQAHGKARDFARTMDAFMDGGRAMLDAGYAASEWAQREGDSKWLADEASVPWMTPLNVRNCIAGGRNFAAHRAETLEYWTKQGAKLHSEIPMGFVKLASVMVPTRSTIHRPEGCEWFDYEVEATAVLGKKALNVDEEGALDAIFGYTVLNDVSAREMQRKEMQNQSILLGKNYPGFGPLGPWIVTSDEVPDPSVLEVRLTVNGEERQHAYCKDMIFSIPQLVAHWSKTGLDRGDLVTVGSPEGVAIGRPDPMAFYLKSGDVVRAEVVQCGVLETFIA